MKKRRTITLFKNQYPSSGWVFLTLLALFFLGATNDKKPKAVYQSQRKIPVVEKVDVVIAGGSTAAVSAAISAANEGASVFLVASRPYLGEDICATLRLERDKNRQLETKLEKKLFGSSHKVTPLSVKATLAESLKQANVKFIFGSYVTNILQDANQMPAGVVIANRAGRQAIVAKSIIDATNRAWVCRMAGAKANDWSGSGIKFKRIIVLPNEENQPEYVEKELFIPMPNLSFPAFAKAEQIARKKTYAKGQLRASESLFHIPPDPLICKKNATRSTTKNQNDPEFYQPEGFKNIFTLNGCAGISREKAEKLLQPAAMCKIGEIIGKKAAAISARLSLQAEIGVKNSKTVKISDTDTDVKEILKGFRSFQQDNVFINCSPAQVPVVADYDVVVIGGGTSGAPAAIAAARNGMRVLVVEYLEGLGGIGTLGLIGKAYHGLKKGFAAEVPFPKKNIEPKMEWYRKEISNAGGDIWLGAMGCGAVVKKNSVKGVIVVTPEGRFAVTSKIVIDATGNSDIAIAAGADYMHAQIEQNDIAIQGTGMSSRPLKGNYYNSDFLIVDETDMVDVWRSLVSVHITKAKENTYDVVPIIQSRERRRIVGDYVLTYLDQISGRTFPDAILFSGSDYDSHGYPSSPYFALLPHDSISKKQNHPAPGGTCYTPYRCLLPKGLKGILVTGLGISMDRDATAMVRMQLDMANQGYAAGMAAASAINSNKELRKISIDALQKSLAKMEIIPKEALKYEDSFPLSVNEIKKAVKAYGHSSNPQSAGKPLAMMLSHKELALPFVYKEFKKAKGKSKLLYALVLGMWGSKEGNPVLLEELKRFEKWDEKIYQGSMADYAHLPTPQDAIILALGYSGDKSVVPHLLKLIEKLDKDVTLSHHRSLALALEKLGDTDAAQPLAGLLQQPGMSGHVMHKLEDAMTGVKNNGKGAMERTKALREIVIARALYNCGDYNNIGKQILQRYTKDIRGLLARHASSVLSPDKK